MTDNGIEELLARMDAPGVSRAECFPFGGTLLHTQRKKETLKVADRRAARRFVEAKNADCVIAVLPAAGDSTHCILPGDFVFCDLLARLVDRHGCPMRIDISTLSLSEGNVQTLVDILNHHAAPALTLVASVYFWSTNQSIARAIETRLAPHPRCRVALGRQHTKLVLVEYPNVSWVFAGSANLRSAGCYEQVVITDDSEVLAFYRGWLEKFHATAAVKPSTPLIPVR